MRLLVSLYLALSLGGVPGAVAAVLAAEPHGGAPVVRHNPPEVPFLGATMAIQAVVEGGTRLASIRCWYRAQGASKYDSIEMTKLSGNSYECRLEVSESLADGVEYFVEAVGESGAKGTDGTTARPYFVTVREPPSGESLSLRTTGEPQETGRSIWRSPWLWLGAALAVAGGIAVANGGGKENNDTGTIVVE